MFFHYSSVFWEGSILNEGGTMIKPKNRMGISFAAVAIGLLGGCVSIESGTISESQQANTGTTVKSSTSNDGFFEIFGTNKETAEANKALVSQCTNGTLTDVQDQLSKRDVLLLVQIYTVRARGVCVPQAAPVPVAVAPAAPVAQPAPKHTLVHAKKTKRGLVFTLGAVLFATNKADLNDSAEKSINELTAYLKDHPNRNIMVEGYTDSQGSAKYNQALSVRRAKAVRGALVSAGIDSSRIKVSGYGARYPVASNKTAAARQKNRRVEVVISDQHGMFKQNR